MKRLCLLSAFLLCMVFTASAQVKVGVKAGGARLTHIYRLYDYPTQKHYGNNLHFGVFTTIPLSEIFQLRPELIYSSGRLSEVFNFGPEGYNTFSLPVLVGYKPLQNLTFLAGPEVTYLPFYYDKGYYQNGVYGGISGGINYRFWRGLSLDATYTHGLTNKRQRGSWYAPTPYPFFEAIRSNTSNSIRLGLAYTFGKNSDL